MIKATVKDLKDCKCGEKIYFTGTVYTARDAAHMRIKEMLDKGEKLPFDLNGALIYYAGPTPTKPKTVIGSIGPTTSARMDMFADLMPKLGVIGTIGKGPRNESCVNTYQENKTLYFVVTGGIGALLSNCITKAEEIAFKDLGPESIKKLEVKDFPMTVAIDYEGKYLFGE